MFTIIKKLNEKEFQKTFSPPMRFIGENEESTGVNLKKYLQKIIRKENLDTNLKDIEIHYVYRIRVTNPVLENNLTFHKFAVSRYATVLNFAVKVRIAG